MWSLRTRNFLKMHARNVRATIWSFLNAWREGRAVVAGLDDASHLSALLSAQGAGTRTVLAVVVTMLFTFRATCHADFGAHAATVHRELRTAAHQRRSKPAKLCAVSVEPDTLRHSGTV